MKIKEYRTQFIASLTPIYGALEAESFFSLALEHYHGMKRSDLAMNPDAAFSPDEIEKWNNVLSRLNEQIPIQYILGNAHFFGMEFFVDRNVLIPRPETEELVQWILSEAQSVTLSPKILDIGTGSGCIAIALAKNISKSHVDAVDISEAALEVAKKNAALNNASVNFAPADILQVETLEERYDIIVSNPPYVRILEKSTMLKNVLASEPHLALFVNDDDPLLFYRKIADLAVKHLTEDGLLYFEINQYLGNEMIEMLENKGFTSIEIRQDIYGNDRMMRCRKPNYS